LESQQVVVVFAVGLSDFGMNDLRIMNIMSVCLFVGGGGGGGDLEAPEKTSLCWLMMNVFYEMIQEAKLFHDKYSSRGAVIVCHHHQYFFIFFIDDLPEVLWS
jgi:hypothetical protein